MVVISCSVPGCDFKTQDLSETLVVAILTNHNLVHNTTPPRTDPPLTPAPVRGPKLDRPRIDIGVTVEEWNVFTRRWEVFRSGSGIDTQSAPSQLFQCAGPELGDSILKANPNAATESLPNLLAAMKSLAVIPVATCVLRTELLQLRQNRDEPFRSFVAKVRGKAETCSYAAKCTCGADVNYTDHVIRDVILNGLFDTDIKREVLGASGVLELPINDIIALVESKEMARNALPSHSLSAVSSFQKQKATPPNIATRPSPSDQAKEGQCPECHTNFRVFTQGARGWNKTPHKVCIDCYRAARRKNRQQDSRSSTTSAVHATESESISQIATIHTGSTNPSKATKTRPPAVRLDHHIFSKGEWKRARLRDHPRVPVTVTLLRQTPGTSSARGDVAGRQPPPPAEVSAVADTGAQSDLWSLSDFMACGFSCDDLRPINVNLSAANHSPISIEGAFFAKLSTTPCSGKTSTCHSMIYVSSSVKDMYLSFDSLLNLGLLPRCFPSPGDSPSSPTNPPSDTPQSSADAGVHAVRSLHDGCMAPTDLDATCACPLRDAAPPRPSELPFPCSPDNNTKMRSWLLERYASSTFNTCPHRALPCMEGPPIEIHVDPSASPKACHTAANIPLHWQQRVYEDLLRDEALGVIERVPYGEPVSWCHRMVITRKHDGSPRRTVDLSPLNKFCQRETFATESPFHLARRIPTNTWKTVTDAWNGYHSILLRPSDRHLTTFITPFGRWRYTRAPQGFLSSGDGYNRRFDEILAEFERKERCVDDTVHYDTDLEEHWWRTVDLLTRLGQAGVVLNPDKFQFAERTVDFAGFRVSDATIEPLPKYLDAIREFPTPTSTTDIRSWFGLVNQVANYAQLRDLLAPFKPFLSPRCKFLWNAELEEAFQASKAAIVNAIRQGVEIFDLHKRTCLRPDWSRKGIGYFLLQQHCSCPTGTPDCCPGGWRITLAGSRFLSSAEQRYAAIEGEALAVAWGLEQTRYFTQGCEDLIIVTDHKPLVKIFGDRTLDEISNSRLFRLKQRTLPWRFEIRHLPGKSNHAADATSRHPSPSSTENAIHLGSPSASDMTEEVLMSAIRHDAQKVGTISWSLLADETAADDSLGHLLRLIEGGQPVRHDDPALTSLKPIIDSLYSEEGVILYQDRVVVPSSLRGQVLQTLHAAHQGTTSMEQRARAIVYWPGMTNDIRQAREKCTDCNRHAPSQAATPPLPTAPPSTPFEAVFADFFDHIGRHYLVVGDRLSGWVEVLSSTTGTDIAGSAGLIRHLRSFFATFGVPEELSSDGGPEFVAKATEDFLHLWGVRHRLSSVSFPQSNGRAEVAVKTAKRLLMSNTSPTGSLDHDGFLRAILQLRNTPDPDCNLSPAQIVFGRPLRDTLAFVNRLEKFTNPHVRPLWRKAWEAKEDALRTRITRTTEALTAHSKHLRPLSLGEKVFLQNQKGPSANKWDRSGVVVEDAGHDQYRIKVDGSGRVTLRNRRFLRAYTPATPSIQPDLLPPLQPLPQRIEQAQPIPPPAIQSTPSADVVVDDMHGDPAPVPPGTNRPDVSPPHSHPPPPQGEFRQDPTLTEPAPPLPPEATRSPSRRVVRPPKHYEPETGNWVN